MQNHLAFAKDMLLPMADEHNLMSSVCNRRGCASCNAQRRPLRPCGASCDPPSDPPRAGLSTLRSTSRSTIRTSQACGCPTAVKSSQARPPTLEGGAALGPQRQGHRVALLDQAQPWWFDFQAQTAASSSHGMASTSDILPSRRFPGLPPNPAPSLLCTSPHACTHTLMRGSLLCRACRAQAHEFAVRAMAWNNAVGTYFVSADMKGIIKVWDYSQACIKQFQGHKEAPLHPFLPVRRVRFRGLRWHAPVGFRSPWPW